jgi:LPXTG-site transpeptidase (sortase) family protein
MLKLLVPIVAVVAIFVLPVPLTSEIILPVPTAEAAEPALFPTAANADHSFKLSIPSIKLNAPVVRMGLNTVGDLDVPSGKTNNVGWYKNGTVPGEVGSAVMHAHVYAAFKNLHNVKVGDDVYVEMESGATLHFKITEKKTLPLAQISATEFYNRAQGRELHLITCAGTYSSKTGTYSHRVLVYATLVG